MKNKKIIKILLLSSILIASLLVLSGKVEAATYTADQLRSKFNEIRNMQGYRAGDYYKWNDGGWYSDYCSSGHVGWQCHGYGINLFDWLFGQCAMCAGRVYDMNQVRVGDLIRYNNDPWGEHTIIVQDVVGDTVYFTDANGDGAGHVRWDQSTTKSYLQSKLVYIAHASGNDVKTLSDSEKPKIVDSGIDMSSITASSFKIRVKATDNVGVTSVGFNIWAPNSSSHVWKKATYNTSTGYWEYTVRKSSFGNAAGVYCFDTYVSDDAGNSTNKGFSPFPMGTTVVKTLGDFTARIVSKQNTNYVIGTDGTQNESSAVLKTKSLSDNSQIWKFTKNSDNTYTITHVLSGKVLDIHNYSNENRAKVQIYTKGTGTEASFGTNQKFYIMSYNGGYRIVPKCSNDLKAIDNADAKVASGNKMQLYEGDRTSNAAQTWTFEKVATALSMNTTSTSIRVGESKSLSATITPSNVANRNLTWSSSNRSIVTVSSNGIIKGIKMGTATITAKTTDGSNKTATCRVTVTLPFTDVPLNSWYYSAVEYCYANNIIKGLNDTTFAPDQNLTRGMLVTILHRMEGSPYVSGKSKFSDVQDTNEYYYVAVKWATQNNIVSGYHNGKFGPNDPITREQLAVILNQYCRYKGKYKASATTAGLLNNFSDGAKVSNYAIYGMKWAIGSGVITGSKGRLNPQGTATRAEVASMLYKYCLNIK